MQVTVTPPPVQSVLVVEDDAAMGNAIQRTLERHGFNTLRADSGHLAVRLVSAHRPVVMTLDLTMPGFSGFDVIRAIRNETVFTDTKILVVSARSRPELQEALDVGADDALEKPFANSNLVDKVTRLAQGSRSHAGKPATS